MTQGFSIPAHYAAEILAAWGGGDRDRLSANLTQAAALELPGDPVEEERAEVLASVAVEMRAMTASGKTESEAVCLELLRRLARQGAGGYTAH